MGPEHRKQQEKEVHDLDPMVDSDVNTFFRVIFIQLLIINTIAITVDDLSLVFGVLGAYKECVLNYFFPTTFFLKSLHYSRNTTFGTEWRIGALAYSFVGIIVFIFTNYYTLKKGLGDSDAN